MYNWNVREKRISGSASREDAAQFSGINQKNSFLWSSRISRIVLQCDQMIALVCRVMMEMICTGTAKGTLICMPGIKSKWNLIYSFFSVSWASRYGKNERIRSFHFRKSRRHHRKNKKKLVLKLIFSLNSEFVFHAPKQRNIKLSVDKLSIQVRHFHKRILISLPLQARPGQAERFEKFAF